MSALLRWVRKQLEEHQRLEEAKARETERRIQREQRDSEQARALSLTLCELQRSMDTPIAAQFYNDRFCPFSRLPEELLLNVLDFLADDPVTLHCLQAVSRIFLRLLDRESDIWRDEWDNFDRSCRETGGATTAGTGTTSLCANRSTTANSRRGTDGAITGSFIAARAILSTTSVNSPRDLSSNGNSHDHDDV
ncbi:hypothetical protein INS49_002960 [Diaporthe citri]|uniref:uncharacterized protein n=1 Tax=Diaporthe citri TaxID=83186 RepID=UPI001C813B10|nr:uncharacterized protein INS49_002960 [Diaporthe citri]KAG6368746.1 hypothetical protein INS49_002960 [Diaporthe citri]